MYVGVGVVALKLVLRGRAVRYAALAGALLALFMAVSPSQVYRALIPLVLALENLAYISSVYADRSSLLSAAEGLVLSGANRRALLLFRALYSGLVRIALTLPLVIALVPVGVLPPLYMLYALGSSPLLLYVVERRV